MILGGSNIQTQTNNSFEIQAVFSVTQCIFYDSTFRHRKQATGTSTTPRESHLFQYMWGCCYMVKPANVAWLINSMALDYQYQMTKS